MVLPRPTARGVAVLLPGILLFSTAQALRDPALVAPGVALLALWVASGLVAALGRPRWHAERRIVPDELGLGDEGQMELRLHRGGGLPLLDLTDDPGEALGERVGFLPAQGPVGSVRYPVRGRRRGVYAVDELAWTSGDPMGLWTTSGHLRAPATVTVWPRVHAWDDTWLAMLPDGTLGRPTTDVDDALVREYRPGDDPRRIHWRSTARAGATMVRRERQADDPRVTIVVDTRAMLEDATAAERAIEAAASAAVALLRAGVGVRIVAADGTQAETPALASAQTSRAGGGRSVREREALNALAALAVGAPSWDARVRETIADHRADETVLAAVARVDAETLALVDAAPLPGVAVVLDDADGACAALESHGWRAVSWDAAVRDAHQPRQHAGRLVTGASTTREWA